MAPNIEPKAGTTVTWVNDDVVDHAVMHDAKGGKSLFAGSGDLKKGKGFSYTFSKAGTYTFYCSTPGHRDAGMTMTVEVEG